MGWTIEEPVDARMAEWIANCTRRENCCEWCIETGECPYLEEYYETVDTRSEAL